MEENEEHEFLRLRAEEKWEEILEKFDKNKFLPWVWPEKKNLEFIGKSVRKQNSNSLISIGCGSGLLEWLLAAATGVEVTGIEADGNWWTSRYSGGTFIPVALVEDPRRGDFGVDTQNAVLLFCYFNNLRAFLDYISNFKGNCFIGYENRGVEWYWKFGKKLSGNVTTGRDRETGAVTNVIIIGTTARGKEGDDYVSNLGRILKTGIEVQGSDYNSERSNPGVYSVQRRIQNCLVIGPGRGRGTYSVPEPFHLPDVLEENWKLYDHQEIRSSKDFIAVYVRK